MALNFLIDVIDSNDYDDFVIDACNEVGPRTETSTVGVHGFVYFSSYQFRYLLFQWSAGM